MAVLPPVIVPCVEPTHTFSPATVEPSHTFTPDTGEPSHGVDVCEALVLSLGAVSMTINLSWILYNSPVTPASYNIYRKKDSDVYFQLLDTNIQANTYADSNTQVSTTYDYYVRPVFPSGIEGLFSNIVVATTPALVHIYTLRSGGMDIYNMATPTSPFRETVLTDGNHNGGGGVAWDEISDFSYMWLLDGSTGFTYQTDGNELNPVKGTNLSNVSNIIVRRGLVDRNNLLIMYNYSTVRFESYDITNPLSPTLVGTSAVAYTYCPNTLSYDAVNHHIIACFNDGFSFMRPYYSTLNADGTISGLSTLGPNLDGAGQQSYESIIYNNWYWVGTRGNGLYAQKLDGSGANVAQINFPWNGVRLPIRLRLRGKYLFVTSAQPNAGWQALRIYDFSTQTLLWELGGTNAVCNGLMTSGNFLVFSIATTLYVYDMTGLIASGSIPTLLGSVSVGSTLNGITGSPSDGWEGNNGGCAT